MKPALTLSPKAFHKLMWLCEATTSEVGAMGISDPGSPLYVEDLFLPTQTIGASSTEFDDEGLSDFAAEMIKKGYQMNEFMRIWIHTHPTGVSGPSGTDEKTFKEALGKADWAVMLILPKGGKFYCRLRIWSEPIRSHIAMEIPVEVDWANLEGNNWDEELKAFTHEYVWIKQQNCLQFSNFGGKSSEPMVKPTGNAQTQFEKDKIKKTLDDMCYAGWISEIDHEKGLQCLQQNEALPDDIADLLQYYDGSYYIAGGGAV